jgi:hypothetical protein
MSAIFTGTQRETVKDMVLADYQVPKGVSSYKLFAFGFLVNDAVRFGRLLTFPLSKKHCKELGEGLTVMRDF